MPPRPHSKPRSRPRLELLEQRLAPTGTTVFIRLDTVADEFGNQIITVQGYESDARSAFGIFDTGASALTFSAGDQGRFMSQGIPIPIKVFRGAVAEGLGGAIVGDVSNPGTILVDGLHAAGLSFDSLGHARFTIQFTSGSAATPGIQAFVGTPDGSPSMPTITGMPILDSGLAALINMQGATLDFSQVIPDLILSMPDVSFVSSGTALPAGPDGQGPVRIPLTLVGYDNYLAPGNSITEARVPFQNNVSLLNHNYGSISGQSFLFDTGAQVTVISSADAKALGLDLQHPQFSTFLDGVGGRQRVGGYTIDELDLPTSDGGGLHFTNVPVFVADLGAGVDGVLGMNLFNTATGMLYDPFGPGLASVSLTFSKLGRTAEGATPDIIAKLDRLGVPFAAALHGSQLPGFTLGTGTISGQVFLDFNGNGIVDPGEPGLAGRTVFLDLRNSGQLDPGDPYTTTDANGFYQFTGLAPGNYAVRELPSAGLATIEPARAFSTVVVPQGSTTQNVNLGNFGMQPDATTAFVAELYGTLLDRAPDAVGLNHWVQKLNQGLSRESVARAIWESAEHRGLQVDSFYHLFLNRPADPAGRQSWVSAFLSGLSEDQVEQRFLISPEYQQNHRDDSAFLSGLYENVLGRQKDTAGSLVWQTALQQGMARATVALAFLTSAESNLRTLDRYYGDFLHRSADAAGEQTWMTLLESGQVSLEQVGGSFLGSAEFFAWAKQLSQS